MLKKFSITCSLFLLALPLLAAEPSENCKIAVKQTDKNGKRKMTIERVHASSREDCKQQAKAKEINSDPEEIDKVTATFSYVEK